MSTASPSRDGRGASVPASRYRPIVAALSVLLAATGSVRGATPRIAPMDAHAAAQHERLERLLPPPARKRATEALAGLRRELILAAPEADLERMVRQALGDTQGRRRPGDVDVLVCYILMEAADDAEADAVAMHLELGRANHQQASQRAIVTALRERHEAAAGDLRRSHRALPLPGPAPAARVELPLLRDAGVASVASGQPGTGGGAAARPAATLATPRFGVLYPAAPSAVPAPPAGLSGAELQEALAQAQATLDTMSSLAELTSLRLQMLLDRRAKLLATLSNLLSKISQTQDSVIQNMK